MQPDVPAHLWDAADACRNIGEFIRGVVSSEFMANLMLRSAVERQLEVLGEALNRIRRQDPETASRIPEIDRIIGLRNVIAHQYGEIDYKIIWSAITVRLPVLLEVIDRLLLDAPVPDPKHRGQHL